MDILKLIVTVLLHHEATLVNFSVLIDQGLLKSADIHQDFHQQLHLLQPSLAIMYLSKPS